MADYWNHNTAYHPWLVSLAARHRGDVLDVGCGDGLLAQRLAPVSRSVVGIDPDAAAVHRARTRLAAMENSSVVEAGFADYPSARFDLITFVASLHHLELRPSLLRARRDVAAARRARGGGLEREYDCARMALVGSVPSRGARGIVAASGKT
ncbi:hypothetical protein MPSYJ_27320 [Mycolicibacterium psychrotolerans]|uniref:Methyltransferase domain-containing protein n=1 Tax=Mycolicibacterium psychrotolerans TaxID=216929 RepID=A0A7I7MAJ6_9MYCO|nr:hypothetical protein MPSYJ_27320 [Mycolicibacterium psychrotolerans]